MKISYYSTSSNIVHTILESPDPNGFPLPADGDASLATTFSGALPALRVGTSVVALPARPNDYSEWDPVAGAWVGILSLAMDAKWHEIQAARDAVEYGTFTVSGAVYQGDKESRDRISSAALSAFIAKSLSLTWSIDWTLADNSSVTLNADGMLAVFAEMEAVRVDAHDIARGLREDIFGASDVEEVEEVVWPSP